LKRKIITIMANTLTLTSPTPATVPADGWIVGYKILGDPGAYTVTGPHVSMPINIPTLDAVGTLYEGYIQRDCGANTSTFFFWQTPCSCTEVGYVESPAGTQCELNETTAATVTNSGYCLAIAQQNVYSSFLTRIYNTGFTDAIINSVPGTIDPLISQELTADPQWANPTLSTSLGPMNREAVWIDSDCDGDKDALSAGVETTIAYIYNNVTMANKTIYIGVGGDNEFRIVVNGIELVDATALSDRTFKIWHILPVVVVPGANYINIVGTGDGGVNDALGLVVYDNTEAEIAAATTDLDLTIPFRSGALAGTTFDVATCPPDYSLDSSGGSGNYICRKTTYMACNTLP
jgi:hypothetical protein